LRLQLIRTYFSTEFRLEMENDKFEKIQDLLHSGLEEKDLKILMEFFDKKYTVEYFSDIYYDTLDFQLARRNLWLKERVYFNSTVDMKVSLNIPSENRKIYEEKDIIKCFPVELQKTHIVDNKFTDLAQISVTRLVFERNNEKLILDCSMLSPGDYILSLKYLNGFG
jgi:hypothetical protein